MDVKGRVTVITGTSSGLGRRFALDMAAGGAIVIGLARRADLLDSLKASMQAVSPSSSTVVCDVTAIDAFTGLLGQIEKEHGRIDILVNNAGVGEPPGGWDGVAAYRELMETNYFAPVASTLAVLPGMRRRGHGVVVNVSSDSGRAPSPRELVYGASKAALSAFTESVAFAVEGSGVHVHVLYPGWVPTPMGSAAFGDGQPALPRSIRRSEEQVSRLLLSRMGRSKVEIDATLVARLAPVARAVAPRLYRAGVRKATGAGPLG